MTELNRERCPKSVYKDERHEWVKQREGIRGTRMEVCYACWTIRFSTGNRTRILRAEEWKP